jgi:hypothetical protein
MKTSGGRTRAAPEAEHGAPEERPQKPYEPLLARQVEQAKRQVLPRGLPSGRDLAPAGRPSL